MTNYVKLDESVVKHLKKSGSSVLTLRLKKGEG